MSLLAIAVDQPLPMLNDTPLSRAGSLLQLDRVWSVGDWSAVRPPSLASQLPQNQDQKIAACGSSYREDKYNPHAAHAAPLQDERKLGCRS
ncbi:hypothetical protein C3E97_015840 [Pseudomonas sp. MWU12-2115]|nr:hypothetical protein C3E97_015840 [Pseudomonas sp. MWU12-2115]